MVVRKMKEKCKDAARMRREKERAEFVELSKLLPLPASTTSQLDKASIIRLTSSYLRMRAAFPQGLGENWGQKPCKLLYRTHVPYDDDGLLQCPKSFSSGLDNSCTFTHKQMTQVRELGSLLLQTLDGFVFALHRDGKIMYISETASVHLGLPQIDLTGSSVFEYVHPSDHSDIHAILGLTEADSNELEQSNKKDDENVMHHHELGRSFCMRMRCILPKRNAGLVSSGYKAIHCNGYLKVRKCKRVLDGEGGNNSEQQQKQPVPTPEWESYALVAVGHSLLPTASTEVKLTGNSFMFRANLDLRIYYIETPVIKLLGYDQVELIGQSLYQFVHVNDTSALEKSHRSLLDKGQVVTRYYRLMKRDGGFIWVQSYATIVNNHRNLPKPNHIVGICSVLAEDPLNLSVSLPSSGQQQAPVTSQKQQQSEHNCSPVNVQVASNPIVKSVSSGYESASSVSYRGETIECDHQPKNQQKKDKYLTQRKLRKLRTSLGAGSTIKPKPAASSANVVNKIPANVIETSAVTGKCPSSCSRLNQQDCTCTQSCLASAVTLTVPPRRSSDDTCSIVSSIASTSLSSNASSHHASEFMNYTAIDPVTAYQASGSSYSLDSNFVLLPHQYNLFDGSPTMGHPDLTIDRLHAQQQQVYTKSFATNQLPRVLEAHGTDTATCIGEGGMPSFAVEQPIWSDPATSSGNHFSTDNHQRPLDGYHHMEHPTQLASFNHPQHLIAPQTPYLHSSSSPEWYDNQCMNQSQQVLCHASSHYHESPPYPTSGSSIYHHQTVINNRYTMSSSSSS